jgi:hypothetical protein
VGNPTYEPPVDPVAGWHTVLTGRVRFNSGTSGASWFGLAPVFACDQPLHDNTLVDANGPIRFNLLVDYDGSTILLKPYKATGSSTNSFAMTSPAATSFDSGFGLDTDLQWMLAQSDSGAWYFRLDSTAFTVAQLTSGAHATWSTVGTEVGVERRMGFIVDNGPKSNVFDGYIELHGTTFDNTKTLG